MIDFIKFFLSEEILEKDGKALLNELQKLYLKLFIAISAITTPLVFFSIIPLTINGTEYSKGEGVFYLLVFLLIMYFIMVFITYFSIESSKKE